MEILSQLLCTDTPESVAENRRLSIAASRVSLRPLFRELTGGGGKYYPPAMRVRLATSSGHGLKF